MSSEHERDYLSRLKVQIDQADDYFPGQLRGHRLCRVAVIVFGGAVPVLASWPDCPRLLLALLGGAAAGTEAFAQLMQFQSKAANAMRAVNELRREMNLFLFQAGPYAKERSFPQFVERIEEIRAVTSGSFLASLQKGAAQPPAQSGDQPTERAA